jgi:hypothetical protein
MSKYASAWANYDGGYIVFGIENPQSGAPLVIDGGVQETIKPRLGDWLDTVIPSLVEPPLQRLSTLLIHPKSEVSRIGAGKVLIAIHIPESEIAPHQALDRKYYQRLGRRLEPLRHRAIQDIAGRRRFPRIRTVVLIHSKGFGEPSIFWKMENFGPAIALHWKVLIRFPTCINGNYLRLTDEEVVLGETMEGESFLELRIPQRMGSPLFPQSDISRSFKLSVCTYKSPLKPSIDNIRVTTFADEMPPFREIIRLDEALRGSKRLQLKDEHQ